MESIEGDEGSTRYGDAAFYALPDLRVLTEKCRQPLPLGLVALSSTDRLHRKGVIPLGSFPNVL